MGLAELRNSLDAAKQRVKDEGQTALKEEFKSFFDQHPEIEAVRWEQYTPYFNDGDPCEFGFHGFYVKYKDDASKPDPEAYEYEDGFVEPEWKSAVEKWWGSIRDEDIFEASFGDHLSITATREGFEISEYDHD